VRDERKWKIMTRFGVEGKKMEKVFLKNLLNKKYKCFFVIK
jgi:hypothetical protein